MPDVSPILSLPLLRPSQAQKHVSHNEAVQRLDVLVQLVVESFGALTPPTQPDEGTVFALGATATDEWAGHDHDLAIWLDGAWQFIAPQNGWRAWGRDVEEMRLFRDGAWVLPSADLSDLSNLDGVGIGTSYDSINRLTVSAEATLLNHEGAGHQLKVNKAASGDTASLLFQSNWSGRAEIGLIGDDVLGLKVSADGAVFRDAMRVNPVNGQVQIPQGLSVSGAITGSAVQSGPTDSTAGKLMKVGAFGMPIAVDLTSSDNLDDVLQSGFYYNPSAGNTAGNNYPISFAGSLIVIYRSDTNVTQRFSAYAGTGGVIDVRVFERTKGNGGWTPWSEQFGQGNILGTVSQSGGAPTGAVIERDDNANGHYVRYADGTQMCWTDDREASGNPTTWTFPASFSTAPSVQASVADNHPRIAVSVGTSTTSTDIYVYNDSGGLSTTVHTAFAIGRWF